MKPSPSGNTPQLTLQPQSKDVAGPNRPDILLILAHAQEVNESVGIDCYSNWFIDSMGLRDGLDRVRIHNIAEDPDIDPGDEENVIVGGSVHCVEEDLDWMKVLKEFIRGIRDENKRKFLGICFGHQIAAEALGGQVVRNPNGVTADIVSYTLTGHGLSDPIFDKVPGNFKSSALHKDVVVKIPSGASILAGSKKHPHQALRVGEKMWTMQPHPEMRTRALSTIIEARRSRYIDEFGIFDSDRAFDAHLKTLNDDEIKPTGDRILRNFLEIQV